MLEQAQMDDLSHPDRLQRELALTFARALHSHTCTSCGMLRVCTVVACEFRPDDRRLIRTAAGTVVPVVTERWTCFECRVVAGPARLEGHSRGGLEWAGDEPGGGDE